MHVQGIAAKTSRWQVSERVGTIWKQLEAAKE
jgi:hypothetical protein